MAGGRASRAFGRARAPEAGRGRPWFDPAVNDLLDFGGPFSQPAHADVTGLARKPYYGLLQPATAGCGRPGGPARGARRPIAAGLGGTKDLLEEGANVPAQV